jgi:molybdenum cofactor synthesis domain-containing protein
MNGLSFAVLTCSDAFAAGESPDTAGPALVSLGEALGWELTGYEVVVNERARISAALVDLADQHGANLVLTTGGTGLGPKDVTPEATLDVADREVPGIAEAIRVGSAQFTKRAMLSRGVAVQRGSSLIVNLPGSEQSARESFELIADSMPSAVRMTLGEGKCKTE